MKSCPNHGPIEFAVPGIHCPACGEELEYSPDAYQLREPTTTTLAHMFSRPTVVKDSIEREKVGRVIDSTIAGLQARRDQSADDRQIHELTLLVNQALDFRAALLGTREAPRPQNL